MTAQRQRLIFFLLKFCMSFISKRPTSTEKDYIDKCLCFFVDFLYYFRFTSMNEIDDNFLFYLKDEK